MIILALVGFFVHVRPHKFVWGLGSLFYEALF